MVSNQYFILVWISGALKDQRIRLTICKWMDPNVQGLKSETCNFLCHKRCSKYYQDVRFSILVNHIYADLWEETDDAIIFLKLFHKMQELKYIKKQGNFLKVSKCTWQITSFSGGDMDYSHCLECEEYLQCLGKNACPFVWKPSTSSLLLSWHHISQSLWNSSHNIIFRTDLCKWVHVFHIYLFSWDCWSYLSYIL